MRECLLRVPHPLRTRQESDRLTEVSSFVRPTLYTYHTEEREIVLHRQGDLITVVK
jgi:hypothetical protein